MNKLLIVDDDIHMLKMLRIMLEAEGYSVDAARNGPDALEKMKADPPPSLVLLDYMMPGMDGLDVLREIKKRHVDAGVIVITGHGSEKVAVEMMKAGALHYIQKPFGREELLRTVRQTLATMSAYEKEAALPRILVVDDDKTILYFVTEGLEGVVEVVTTNDSTDALNRLGFGFDVLLTDIYMPKMDGIELLKRAKVLSPGTAVVVMTSSGELDIARKALKEGASDYLKKPFTLEELRESVNEVIARRKRESFERLKKRLELQEAREAEQFESTLGIVEALIMALEARDTYTRGHSERVTEYSVGIAAEMGLSKREIEVVRHSARLHDLGKIGTQDTHLYKTTGLSEDEKEMVARHPEIGCNILKSIRLMEEYVQGIRHHHERYDGAGYPDRLKADSIPLPARIISVADAYDAMTSSRPYREGMAKEHAVDEIERNKGIQFDPSVVSAFVGYIMKGKSKDEYSEGDFEQSKVHI